MIGTPSVDADERAERRGRQDVDRAGATPPKTSGRAQRQLDPADDLRAGHAHAAGRVDDVRVDLADADVRVGEDRRNASSTIANTRLVTVEAG